MLKQKTILDYYGANQLQPNSDVIDSRKIQQESSAFMETVQDKLKDIKNFSNWSAKEQMVAVAAVGVMVGALLPFVAVALPVAATGAIVALTLFFAVKAVEYGYEGLAWSARKTVKGAENLYKTAKGGAVHAKDKVKEAVSYVGQATREGTSSALRAMGDGVQKFGRKMSNSGVRMSSLDGIPYSIGNEGQTVVLKTEEKTRNFNSVKEMFIKEVLGDKAVNSSALTKEIFSKLGEKILEKAYSVGGPQGTKKDQLINQLKQQADFVNKLDAKKLQNLLSKDNNSLYEIFSEHHDEIKRIVKECKTEHKLSNSMENFNKVAGKYGIRKGSTQSINGLSNTDAASVSTISSEAELLNPAKHKEVKAPSSLREKVPLWLGGKKAPEETTDVKYQVLSESDTLSRQVGKSTFYVDTPVSTENTDKTATIGRRPSGKQPIPVAPPKVPRSPSTDSGMGSGSFTPSEYCTPNASGVSTPSEYCTPNASGVSTPIGNRFSQGVDSEGLKRRLERLKSEPVKQKRDSTSSDLHDSSMDSGPSTPTSLLGGESEQSCAQDEIRIAMEKNLKEFNLSTKTESTQSSLSNRNGSDSGFNSPTSSPTHTMFTNEDGKAKTQADLKETGHPDKLVGQPSTYKSEVYIELQQPGVTAGK